VEAAEIIRLYNLLNIADRTPPIQKVKTKKNPTGRFRTQRKPDGSAPSQKVAERLVFQNHISYAWRKQHPNPIAGKTGQNCSWLGTQTYCELIKMMVVLLNQHFLFLYEHVIYKWLNKLLGSTILSLYNISKLWQSRRSMYIHLLQAMWACMVSTYAEN